MLRKRFWLLPYLFISATLFLVGFSNNSVVIDAGHGGSDSGAVSDGYIEKEWNLDTARACANELVKYGVYVYETRTDDTYISLEDRAKLANDNNVDYFISIHHNSSNGDADRGEVIYSIRDTKSQELALSIENELKNIGQTNVKTYTRSMGMVNYYSVLRNTEMSAIIIEVCFIDNPEDRQIADTKEERERNGIAIAHGILKQLGIDVDNTETIETSTDETNIINKPSATYEQLYQWAINNNASQTFLDNLRYIWDTSIKNGVDPVLVATQCALETDYMRSFVFQTYNNTAGIKETSTTYRNYNTIEDGINAQIEHLMLYAGVGGDNNSWLYGWCPTIEGLSGRWAEDTQYSDKILSMIDNVKNTMVENDTEQIIEKEENNIEENIIEDNINEIKESNIFYDALNRNKDNIINNIQKIKEKFNL